MICYIACMRSPKYGTTFRFQPSIITKKLDKDKFDTNTCNIINPSKNMND